MTLQLWIPDGVTNLKGVLAFSSVGLDKGWPGSADFRDLAKRILDGLATLAKMSRHPELANAPIVSCGHSHGGDYWNYFNACYPDCTAVIFDKSSGGVQYTGAALKTPMIWEIGTMDELDHVGARHFRGQSVRPPEQGVGHGPDTRRRGDPWPARGRPPGCSEYTRREIARRRVALNV